MSEEIEMKWTCLNESCEEIHYSLCSDYERKFLCECCGLEHNIELKLSVKADKTKGD